MNKPRRNPFFPLGGYSFEETLAAWLKPKVVDVSLSEPLPSAIYQFRIQLRSLKPPVWRRVQVPNDLTLHQFHRVIQCVMRWGDCHLHHFEIEGARYGIPDPEMQDILNDQRRRLCDFAVRERGKWLYEYDYGDGWIHVLTLEEVLPPQEGFVPVCLKGARACPPEDCGGPWGYMDKLAILRDPTHEEHDDICDWMGRNWDAERFDLERANAALRGEFAPPRRGRKGGKRRRE
ncbi:MAG: plasmid pRiA4b ORF-3 family protein [Verrucomicrobia bacterium]|nr:plasmid pRiA4b ORF-3 family protein [Verrucomicrobiota bacterium]